MKEIGVKTAFLFIGGVNTIVAAGAIFWRSEEEDVATTLSASFTPIGPAVALRVVF